MLLDLVHSVGSGQVKLAIKGHASCKEHLLSIRTKGWDTRLTRLQMS